MYMVLQDKIERILNRYFPIDWDDPDPALENELEALIFDDDLNFDPIEDDIEELRDNIMNTLYELNHDRKVKQMIDYRARQVDPGFDEKYPKNYR